MPAVVPFLHLQQILIILQDAIGYVIRLLREVLVLKLGEEVLGLVSVVPQVGLKEDQGFL